MADEQQLRILKEEGVEVWNKWRQENPNEEINLEGVDLIMTDLIGVNFRGANLRDAILGGAILEGSTLEDANLGGANLGGANLRCANLEGANLRCANLTYANLRDANLRDANLYAVQALATDFASANFTRACIENWLINSETIFENVICDYIYFKHGQKERRPSDPNRSFEPGEFVALVQKSIETVDLIFSNGIDWKAFLSSYQDIQVKYGEQNVSIQAIEKKSDGAFIIRLNVPPDANKGEIESYAKQTYETELKIIEAKHRAELKSLESHYKNEIISLHKEQSTNMMEIAKLLASKPIVEVKHEPVNSTKREYSNSMTSSEYYQQRLKDLEDNIKQDLELLKDYDDELRYTTDPRTKARYRREIVRQEESVTRYKKEYSTLQQEWVGTPSSQMQEVGTQLRQMDAKLNILLSGQVAIYEDLLTQLDATQSALTQKLQDAVDANQVSEPQMQQMLAVLEERIPLLPPSQAAIAEVIKDPELDVKQKLKVTLPIVPMLVEYEGEFELGSGFNIKSAWEQLVAKLQRR